MKKSTQAWLKEAEPRAARQAGSCVPTRLARHRRAAMKCGDCRAWRNRKASRVDQVIAIARQTAGRAARQGIIAARARGL